MAYEYPRNFLRFVRLLGEGAFGEVAEYQAFRIKDLQPQDKGNAAYNVRKKLQTMKNVSKKIDKYLENGNRLDIVAVKVLKGK